MSKELWRDIDGYAGRYQVSSRGRIKSFARYAEGRIRRLQPGGTSPYLTVELKIDGRRKRYLVHRLVLTAFQGPPSEKQVARHLDGDPLNNDVTNLKWGTMVENHADKHAHGTVLLGQNAVGAKLTNAEVIAMRDMYAEGTHTLSSLSSKFTVSTSCVSKILLGDAYGTVGGPRKCRGSKTFLHERFKNVKNKEAVDD